MDSLSVTIHTREGIVFQGPAFAVTATNHVGLFDVLPMHANFVTTLFESVMVHTANKPYVHTMERGLLWARSGNLIDIYIGIGGEEIPTVPPRGKGALNAG